MQSMWWRLLQFIITSDIIWKDILRKSHINAPSVMRLSHRSRLLQNISEHTVARNHINATYVIRVSHRKVILQTMHEHTSEKPYQSNHCDKAITEKQNHTKHKNTNWGKPCKCSHCNKAFIRNSNLLILLMTQTVEKSYHYNIW